jgi:hypothetical protein
MRKVLQLFVRGEELPIERRAARLDSSEKALRMHLSELGGKLERRSPRRPAASAIPRMGGEKVMGPRGAESGLRRLPTGFVAATLAVASVYLVVALGACGGDGGGNTKAATEKDFDPHNFSNGANVDNKWNPLPPGTQFIFEGRSNRGRGRLPHRVVFTVTDLTKVIDGVRTRVLWDRDYNGGKLLEGELAFHAQDDDGNVWNLGEYPEEYDEQGRLEGAPDTWIAGLDGAKAGVLMRADPKVGTPSYHQGLVPAIKFADRATIYKTGQKNCVPHGCYDNVLVTDETNPVEPADGHQFKYCAPGVGNIRAAPGADGKEREVLVLVEVKHLGPAALAKVREGARKLDKRAYRSRRDLYRHTPPVEQSPTVDQSS